MSLDPTCNLRPAPTKNRSDARFEAAAVSNCSCRLSFHPVPGPQKAQQPCTTGNIAASSSTRSLQMGKLRYSGWWALV